MVKVRIQGEDTRKDENGIAHVSWSEAQALAAAGNAEIIQGEDVEEDQGGGVLAGQSEPAGTAGGEPEGGYESLTRGELDALADRRGADTTGARTKADVIEALRGA